MIAYLVVNAKVAVHDAFANLLITGKGDSIAMRCDARRPRAALATRWNRCTSLLKSENKYSFIIAVVKWCAVPFDLNNGSSSSTSTSKKLITVKTRNSRLNVVRFLCVFIDFHWQPWVTLRSPRIFVWQNVQSTLSTMHQTPNANDLKILIFFYHFSICLFLSYLRCAAVCARTAPSFDEFDCLSTNGFHFIRILSFRLCLPPR